MNRFKVGDRIRCVDAVGAPGLERGKEYTVDQLGGILKPAVAVDRFGTFWFESRFELVSAAAPTFKPGDKVTFKTGNDRIYTFRCMSGAPDACHIFDEKGAEFVADLVDLEHATLFDDKTDCERKFAWSEGTLPKTEELHTTSNTALRFNKGKPESDYVLTYDGGIEAVFDEDFDYINTMDALRNVYRSNTLPDCNLGTLLVALRQDAEACGDDIVELLALTNTLGGIKYEPGNYLKGANWRQYFQSAVRHAISIRDGAEFEYDLVLVKNAKAKGVYEAFEFEIERGFPMRGNFFFNILALVHCIRNGLGTDDRIRSTT